MKQTKTTWNSSWMPIHYAWNLTWITKMSYVLKELLIVFSEWCRWHHSCAYHKRFTSRYSQSQKSQKLSLIFRKVEFNSDSYLVIEHSATHGFWSTFSICFLWQVSVEDHKVHSARASQSHHNLPSSDAPMMGHNLRADIINPMAGQPTPPTPKYPTPLGRIISVDL